MANASNPPRSLPWSALRARLAEPPAWAPILLAALLARLPGTIGRPLWYDEALAVLLSSRGPAAVIEATLAADQGVAANVHPPGYFILLWAWGRLLGTSAPAARMLSILAGLITVWLGYRLAGRYAGARAGTAAGWLLALSPFQVHYAQEVRMYALLAMVLVGAAGLYFIALRGGGWRHWAGFAVLAAAAQYLHSLASMLLLPLALIPVLQRRWRAAARTAAAGGLALLLYAPWLVHLPAQWARVQRAYWIAPVGPADLVRTLVVFVAGSPLPNYAIAVALFAGLWLLVIGGWALARGLRRPDPSARSAAALAYLALAPPVWMFGLSLWQPVYLDRAMLPAGAAFLGWAAWALTSGRIPTRMRWTGVVLLAAATALGLSSYYSYRGFPYAPFPEVMDQLRARLGPDEVVVHSNKLTALPSVYYGSDIEQVYLADAPGSASDTLAEPTRRVLGVPKAGDLPAAVEDARGVWFILFDREVDEYAALGYRVHPSLSWLQARFSRHEVLQFGALAVHHWWGVLDANQGLPGAHSLLLGSSAAWET